jgi:parallel beta-helix repeat protein
MWAMDLGGDYCTLQTNTITNNTHSDIFTRWITRITGDHNTVIDNIIVNNTDGLFVIGKYNIIQGNSIRSNHDGGAYISGINTIIKENTISDHLHGIGLTLDKCRSVIITNNNFIKNYPNAWHENTLLLHWRHNYWRPSLHIGPHLISGQISFTIPAPNPWSPDIPIIIPTLNLDLFPRLLPYLK